HRRITRFGRISSSTAASALRPSLTSPLRRENLRLAIVLLYTTGLRRGELVSLTLSDYDADQRTLLIRESKFHKSRVVPLSRDGAGCWTAPCPPYSLSQHADSDEHGRVPRVHDFRHAFAITALMRWYRAGVDVQARLPLLATYMGHVSIVSTAYYLQFVE